MKDFAMEAILALGSGIVLAMFGIGVPDPNETKKAIEVFSHNVSDVIDKTFGSLSGDGVQVSQFTAVQSNLLRTIRAIPTLTVAQKDTVALIIERSTRNAVQQQHDLSLDDALTNSRMTSAMTLLKVMDALNKDIDSIPDPDTQIQRLAEFEKYAERGRNFAEKPIATFEKPDTINPENVAKDANEQFKEATKLFDTPSKSTPTIPLSPMTKKARQGQQTVVQGDLNALFFALNDTGAEPAVNPDKINIWFAMGVDMDTNMTPQMAARKRKVAGDTTSPWINHNNDPTVTLMIPDRDGGTQDQNNANIRIWQFEIDRFGGPNTVEIAFFLEVGDNKSRGLTEDGWLPYYSQVIEDTGQENIFFETFLSHILRAKDQVG